MPILTSFFGMVGGSITSIVGWLVKRFGYSAILFITFRSVQIIMIAFLLSSAFWFTGWLLNLWGVVSDFVDSFQNINVGGGEAFGISLAVIVENLKGFIYASGLSTAIVTSGNLLISMLSLIFVKALFFFYLKIYKILYDMFADGINLLSGTIRL